MDDQSFVAIEVFDAAFLATLLADVHPLLGKLQLGIVEEGDGGKEFVQVIDGELLREVLFNVASARMLRGMAIVESFLPLFTTMEALMEL